METSAICFIVTKNGDSSLALRVTNGGGGETTERLFACAQSDKRGWRRDDRETLRLCSE